MCFVRRVGHGAGCDAARESNHDENRDSVCVLPWYAHRGVLCTTRCSAMCKWRKQKEREGRCEGYKQGVCVCGLSLNDGEPRLQAAAASASA